MSSMPAAPGDPVHASRARRKRIGKDHQIAALRLSQRSTSLQRFQLLGVD